MSGQGQPGRYERSTTGLVGAIVVTVLAVVGFVVYTGAFRDPQEDQRPPVDYLESVEGLQLGGVEVVYPASLPDGWTAVGVDATGSEAPGEAPSLGLDLTTDDGSYVGFEVVADDAEDALDEVYRGEQQVTEAEPLTGSPGLVADWQGWTAGDDEAAYTTTYGDRTLVVFGSAGTDALADLVGRLTVDPLPGVTPSPLPPSPSAS